jgi:hypothetical protein
MVLHHHMSDFKALPSPKPVEDALSSASLPAGMYSLPHFAAFKGFDDPEFAKRMETGPNATIVVMKPGPCLDPMTFVYGYLLNLAEAFGLALAVHYARGPLAALPETVIFSALLGALVHGAPILATSVWMKMPWSHTWKTLGDGVVGFAVVGVLYYYIR